MQLSAFPIEQDILQVGKDEVESNFRERQGKVAAIVPRYVHIWPPIRCCTFLLKLLYKLPLIATGNIRIPITSHNLK